MQFAKSEKYINRLLDFFSYNNREVSTQLLIISILGPVKIIKFSNVGPNIINE